MEYRIFFKDNSGEMRGPFTETQIQEFYMNGSFESSFQFYFTRSDECPSDDKNSGITLDVLQSVNGSDCPFANFDEKKKEEFEKQKMNETENMEKIVKPDFIPVDVWKQFYELGTSVADFVMDGFAVLGKTDFDGGWDWKRANQIRFALDEVKEEARKERDLICEYILVETMKEKEFFCCQICHVTLFNYKQAFIHFGSTDHGANEKVAARDLITTCVFRLLGLFTLLPPKLTADDNGYKWHQIDINGIDRKDNFRPTLDFMEQMWSKYPYLVMLPDEKLTEKELSAKKADPLTFDSEVLIGLAKMSEMGRKAMAEIDEHIGEAQTHCMVCHFNTGDREGLYKHLLRNNHIKHIDRSIKGATAAHSTTHAGCNCGLVDVPRFCLLTLLVNVHKKDLV